MVYPLAMMTQPMRLGDGDVCDRAGRGCLRRLEASVLNPMRTTGNNGLFAQQRATGLAAPSRRSSFARTSRHFRRRRQRDGPNRRRWRHPGRQRRRPPWRPRWSRRSGRSPGADGAHRQHKRRGGPRRRQPDRRRAGAEDQPERFTEMPRLRCSRTRTCWLRMSTPGRRRRVPLRAWPTETFTSRQRSMYLNEEGVQVIREPGAHRTAIASCFFRRADVIVTGDILDLRQFPVIDPAGGGSIRGNRGAQPAARSRHAGDAARAQGGADAAGARARPGRGPC